MFIISYVIFLIFYSSYVLIFWKKKKNKNNNKKKDKRDCKPLKCLHSNMRELVKNIYIIFDDSNKLKNINYYFSLIKNEIGIPYKIRECITKIDNQKF